MAGRITVIGGGLAGSEAAWQIAEQGIDVDLYEMRPVRKTEAHHTNNLAELVCSNSMGSYLPSVASGQLKTEMRRLGSMILDVAQAHIVPAGGALAVDRDGFSLGVTERIAGHPRITLHREELTAIPSEGIVIVATGPLTSPDLMTSLQAITGQDHVYFFDAAAPILDRENLDMDIIWPQSRYDKGEADYLNCPMDKEQYEAFWEALTTAELAPVKDFDSLDANKRHFEACLPIEVIAGRGIETLRFGPMKPVGLRDPRTGRRPYAVVQLRQDNAAGNLYNLVGFQTRLKWGEQKRVFQLIPGLTTAEFVRFGVMHRNAFLNSPVVLQPTLQTKSEPRVFVAGQLTGVEGYTESTAMGILAGQNAVRLLKGEPLVVMPPETMLGALTHYITAADPKHFQPMNANWGILPQPAEKIRDKRLKHEAMAAVAMAALEDMLRQPATATP
ncbi:MAG: methylenetetrahydrofolate--tRNA-(uracil(54)-C(5))-methyltransferase (FADH(2)-oxidizing) TrmFO [Candidatus Sericytochromatia bacterium]|nr:methylenetetrahydrofolate--tRNA-(uracil(54)-C(5))-methyltransferase (FADH(2)-oxidizing) TrmFO [Candidatus Sericytochromatia bacterium]